ncbi:MAG: hypothetical protein HY000_40020 [Planctomycetes bacterium]|nr:hypothetical protein [Planctomycetota bacterium]
MLHSDQWVRLRDCAKNAHRDLCVGMIGTESYAFGRIVHAVAIGPGKEHSVAVERQVVEGEPPLLVGCRLSKRNECAAFLHLKNDIGPSQQGVVVRAVNDDTSDRATGFGLRAREGQRCC